MIRNRAMTRAPKTLFESRARDHAVKCQKTWPPHFKNLFIMKDSWIFPGFKMLINWIEDEKSTRYVGVSREETDWFDRHDTIIAGAKRSSILPHVLAVLSVVCGADTNSQDKRGRITLNLDWARMLFPQQARSCDELTEHEYALRKNENKTEQNSTTRSNFISHYCSSSRC